MWRHLPVRLDGTLASTAPVEAARLYLRVNATALTLGHGGWYPPLSAKAHKAVAAPTGDISAASLLLVARRRKRRYAGEWSEPA